MNALWIPVARLDLRRGVRYRLRRWTGGDSPVQQDHPGVNGQRPPKRIVKP